MIIANEALRALLAIHHPGRRNEWAVKRQLGSWAMCDAGFETLTGAKVTTRGSCSNRTDYFGLELKKVRKGQNKIYTAERD